MIVSFAPSFIRQYKNLSHELKSEIKEKIELFKENPDHQMLKKHKLKGRLKGRYSFSVNYSYRIIFTYHSKNEVILLAVGDHKVYK